MNSLANDGTASNVGGLKEDFNSRLEFRIKIKDLEALKQAIDVSLILFFKYYLCLIMFTYSRVYRRTKMSYTNLISKNLLIFWIFICLKELNKR